MGGYIKKPKKERTNLDRTEATPGNADRPRTDNLGQGLGTTKGGLGRCKPDPESERETKGPWGTRDPKNQRAAGNEGKTGWPNRHFKKKNSGRKPEFGLIMAAETGGFPEGKGPNFKKGDPPRGGKTRAKGIHRVGGNKFGQRGVVCQRNSWGT